MLLFHDFCNFCKKNTTLLIVTTIALLFSYSGKFALYTIGYDTNVFWLSKNTFFDWNASTGRFGTLILQKLFWIGEFNPNAKFFIALCFLWLATISWCFIISVFNNNVSKNIRLIPFALIFLTMPIWAEQFYFVFEAAEFAFAIFLCPWIVYLLINGFLTNHNKQVLLSCLFLVFVMFVNQAITTLFISGSAICLFLLLKNKKSDSSYIMLCFKLLLVLIGALITYFALNQLALVYGLRLLGANYMPNDYLLSTIGWYIYRTPMFNSFLRILVYIVVCCGYMPQRLPYFIETVNPSFYACGMHTPQALLELTKAFGNPLLLPAISLFIIQTIKISRDRKDDTERWLTLLIGIIIPISGFSLLILLGGRFLTRAMWALPLVSAFMFFYLLDVYKNKKTLYVACFILALIISIRQAQITAQLFYTDYLRYMADVRLAHEIDRTISQMDFDRQLPVVFIGRYKLPYQKNLLYGDAIGRSMFDAMFDIIEPSGFKDPKEKDPMEFVEHKRVFMHTIGINLGSKWSWPNDEERSKQMKIANDIAVSMPAYPKDDYIKQNKGLIVIKLSE